MGFSMALTNYGNLLGFDWDFRGGLEGFTMGFIMGTMATSDLIGIL